MSRVQYYGTGRRKSSIARVRLIPGTGEITINGRKFVDYIPSPATRLDVLQPLELTNTTNSYNVLVNVRGESSSLLERITRELLNLILRPF